MSVSIQVEAFDLACETVLLQQISRSIGAIVTFVGLVRDIDEDNTIADLTLEHYPGMAEKEIDKIIVEARQRWQLEGVRVVHRVGALKPADPIVFVGVASRHRGDAFKACEFIMDYLKTRAPFWKKESVVGPGGINEVRWLDARPSDLNKFTDWN